ncbi:hypothetical protein [Paracoccus sp. (in: a-proteobacteria)]|uniref:hypothetical protein n=1 Tax=Paracoccus sp. TaxID=267 RepID=UPI003A88CA99
MNAHPDPAQVSVDVSASPRSAWRVPDGHGQDICSGAGSGRALTPAAMMSATWALTVAAPAPRRHP